MSDYEHPAVCF